MKKFIYCLVMASGLWVNSAAAKDDWDYIPYIGADYINSTVDYKAAKEVDYSTHHNSGALVLGTTMGNYFGTELFAQMSNTYKKENINDKRYFNAYGLDAIGYLPLSSDMKFKLLGSFGLGEYRMMFKNRDLGLKRSIDHGIGFRSGAGAQYNFDTHWALRAMVRFVNFNGIYAADHMMEYTVGARYHF